MVINILVIVILILVYIIYTYYDNRNVNPWTQEDTNEIHEMFDNIKTQEDYDRATYIGIRKE